MNILFTKEQNQLYIELKESYQEEMKLWNLFNVIIPIAIILIPLMIVSFLPEEKITYQNLVLNGSFSILGINILFSMCAFLVNSIQLKDQKIEKQITEIRKRLIIYMCVLLMLSAMTYVLQIAFSIDSPGRYITVTIGCFMFLLLSVIVGKRIYILKDELVGKSYKDDINDGIQILTNSVDDLE